MNIKTSYHENDGIEPEVRKKESETIYIVPTHYGSWYTVIADESPSEEALPFISEGEYPVEVYYERIDMNGSGVMEREMCESRTDLVQLMDWIGETGNILVSLWAFDENSIIDDELSIAFNASINRKYHMIEKSMKGTEDVFEKEMCRNSKIPEWASGLDQIDEDCVEQYGFLLGRPLKNHDEYIEIDSQVDEMILEWEDPKSFFNAYPELKKYCLITDSKIDLSEQISSATSKTSDKLQDIRHIKDSQEIFEL